MSTGQKPNLTSHNFIKQNKNFSPVKNLTVMKVDVELTTKGKFGSLPGALQS